MKEIPIKPMLSRNKAGLLFILPLGFVAILSCRSEIDGEGQRLILEANVCNSESVAELLAEGVDANTKNAQGETPLILAARNNCIDTARYLLQAKADSMAKLGWDETAIYYAAVHGNTEIVGLLLDAGVAVDTKTEKGWTPLMAAAALGHLDTVRKLLEANPKRDSTFGGQSPLDLVSYCPEPGYDTTPIPDSRPYYLGHRPTPACHKDVQDALRESGFTGAKSNA